MSGGRSVVIRGEARHLPLPDDSVDLIVTSPPYYSLRSYTDQGQHYDGQIGAEPTPRQYIESLMECTREWARVLKPSGSMFVNLGDTYCSSQGHREDHDQNLSGRRKSRGEALGQRGGPAAWGVPFKSLIGIPQRYMLAVIDEGLTLRRDIIWSKTNGIPESVYDRARTSHEYVFHIVKERRYFTGIDEIREPHSDSSYTRFQPGRAQPGRRPAEIYNGKPGQTLSLEKGLHPAGRLPGSVWTMPVQPLIGPQCRLVQGGRTVCWFPTWKEGEAYMRLLAREPWSWDGRPSLRPEAEHYAAFPMDLPRKIIQGWSPTGICTKCGQGRRPVVEREKRGGWFTHIPHSRHRAAGAEGHGNEKPGSFHHANSDVTVIGYECDCDTPDAPTRPAVILDPFGGTGCAAMVAASLGRIGISNDYSHSYSRFARWRTTDNNERAKAMQVKKPPPPPDPRQGALFDVGEL